MRQRQLTSNARFSRDLATRREITRPSHRMRPSIAKEASAHTQKYGWYVRAFIRIELREHDGG
jgi:hypothetical protein